MSNENSEARQPSDTSVAHKLITTFRISFALTQDPNELRTSDAPYWPSYISNGNGTVANGESVGFDTLAVTYTTILPAKDADASEKCDFFANKGAYCGAFALQVRCMLTLDSFGVQATRSRTSSTNRSDNTSRRD